MMSISEPVRLFPRLAAIVLALTMFATPGLAQATMTVTDDAGRTVEVPVHPQRVVSQNDNRLTLPLLELGVPLVGSAGRLDANGEPYLRAVPDLIGVGFETGGFAFVGTYSELDYERIAALEPDLIMTMIADQVDQLSAIAPTIVVDPNQYPIKQGMKRIAELTGTVPAYERLLANYERKLATVKPFMPEDVTVSVTFSFPAGEEVYIYNDLGALTVALDDLGISLPEIASEMDSRSSTVSPERWQAIDGDFVINFYGSTPEDGPNQVRAGLDNFLPGWCEHLHACREGQYLFFPYSSFGYAFAALELNLDLLTTHVAGRDFTPISGVSED